MAPPCYWRHRHPSLFLFRRHHFQAGGKPYKKPLPGDFGDELYHIKKEFDQEGEDIANGVTRFCSFCKIQGELLCNLTFSKLYYLKSKRGFAVSAKAAYSIKWQISITICRFSRYKYLYFSPRFIIYPAEVVYVSLSHRQQGGDLFLCNVRSSKYAFCGA
ncbi:MAG: hypothetical protein GF350_02375 [Chitinivibrionales bacterium]|nr:hypothetical protein [Chitinivibrionales bacterium]